MIIFHSMFSLLCTWEIQYVLTFPWLFWVLFNWFLCTVEFVNERWANDYYTIIWLPYTVLLFVRVNARENKKVSLYSHLFFIELILFLLIHWIYYIGIWCIIHFLDHNINVAFCYFYLCTCLFPSRGVYFLVKFPTFSTIILWFLYSFFSKWVWAGHNYTLWPVFWGGFVFVLWQMLDSDETG